MNSSGVLLAEGGPGLTAAMARIPTQDRFLKDVMWLWSCCHNPQVRGGAAVAGGRADC